MRAETRSTADSLEHRDEAVTALRERTTRLEQREVPLDEERRGLEHLRQQLQETVTAPRERSRFNKTTSPM